MRGGFAVAVGGGYAWYAHTSVREDQPEVKAGEARRDKPICFFGVSRYTPGGKPAPFADGKTRFKNMLVLREGLDDHGQIPRGLATDGKRLFIADTAKDRIVVVDGATMKVAREFAAPKPTRLALAPTVRFNELAVQFRQIAPSVDPIVPHPDTEDRRHEDSPSIAQGCESPHNRY